MASPYTSFLASHGLVGCIDRPTRPSSGTCIDHIWAGHYPLSFLLKNSVFETFMLADHFPVILSINTGSNLNNSLSKNTFLRRIFDSYNFGGVSSVLQEQDWGCVLQETVLTPPTPYSRLSFLSCMTGAFHQGFSQSKIFPPHGTTTFSVNCDVIWTNCIKGFVH